jgi:hypothetical protein
MQKQLYIINCTDINTQKGGEREGKTSPKYEQRNTKEGAL